MIRLVSGLDPQVHGLCGVCCPGRQLARGVMLSRHASHAAPEAAAVTDVQEVGRAVSSSRRSCLITVPPGPALCLRLTGLSHL